jgi:hypothetical protein
MPLPVGFKVGGADASKMSEPPQVKKIKAILDALPFTELLTTRDVGIRINSLINGINANHPALDSYHEKVDGRWFWGSRKSIAKLRKQLAEPEENNGKN